MDGPIEFMTKSIEGMLAARATFETLKRNLITGQTSAEDTLLAVIEALMGGHEAALQAAQEQLDAMRASAGLPPVPKPRHLHAVTEESVVRGHHRPRE
jgi:hypothetical protein